MRRLPPLNALRVFEIAARTGSYADAAAELGLSRPVKSEIEPWRLGRLTRVSCRLWYSPLAIDIPCTAADTSCGPARSLPLRLLPYDQAIIPISLCLCLEYKEPASGDRLWRA
jgi:hypothetical protein